MNMTRTLHVQRLPSSTTDFELQKIFEKVGCVVNCDVVADGTTRYSKAIGFVEMGTEAEARRAINRLNGKKLAGRVIRVSEGV
jgi:RNA recognition motif-containing protein